jgi:hypothetical protein
MALCDRNANCLFIKETNGYTCQCKAGYSGSGSHSDCRDNCLDFCRNEGVCLKDKHGNPYCQCAGSFTGKQCEEKSEFAYIAGGVAGAVIFLILLVLLIWCQRYITFFFSSLTKRPKMQERLSLESVSRLVKYVHVKLEPTQVEHFLGAPL